jgi:hypothetical protein
MKSKDCPHNYIVSCLKCSIMSKPEDDLVIELDGCMQVCVYMYSSMSVEINY